MNRKREKKISKKKWECVYMANFSEKNYDVKRTVIMGFVVDLELKLVFGFKSGLYYFKKLITVRWA